MRNSEEERQRATGSFQLSAISLQPGSSPEKNDMAAKTTIYHNPRCGKSRTTLKILADNGIEPEVIEYLKTPPDKAELKGLLKMLGMKPRDLMRRKEKEYKALKLDDPAVSDEALIAAMMENPILIERPIVVRGKKAALGRPPENVLKLLYLVRP